MSDKPKFIKSEELFNKEYESYGLNKLVKCYMTTEGVEHLLKYYKDLRDKLYVHGYRGNMSAELKRVVDTKSIVRPLWIIMKIFGGESMFAGQSNLIEMLDFGYILDIEDDNLDEKKKLVLNDEYHFQNTIVAHKKRTWWQVLIGQQKCYETFVYKMLNSGYYTNEWDFIDESIEETKCRGYVVDFILNPYEDFDIYYK